MASEKLKFFLLDDSVEFFGQFQASILDRFDALIEHYPLYDGAMNAIKQMDLLDERPDLIFVDFDLQEKRTGLDFLRQLRNEDLLLPAVLLSNVSRSEILEITNADEHYTVLDKEWIDDPELLQEVCLYALLTLGRTLAEYRKDIAERSAQTVFLGAAIAHEVQSKAFGLGKYIQQKIEEGSIVVTPTDDEIEKDFEAFVAQQIGHILKITEFLLDHALTVETDFNAREILVSHYLDEYISRFPFSKKVQFVHDHDSQLSINFDDNILTLILDVLINNSIQYCGQKPRCSVSVSRFDLGDDRFVAIDFSDNGPGIPPEKRHSIFRPGDRAGKKIKYRNGGGLGLGLAFAHHLVSVARQNGYAAQISCIAPDEGGDFNGARFRLTFRDLTL